jgi:hypothetical protein
MDVWGFFRENWSQFSFLLLGIGYIVKVILATIYKKKEMRYSLFYQQKIDTAKKCIKAYFDAKYLFYEIPYRDIIANKLPASDIDNMIQPTLTNVRVLFEQILLFYDKEIYEKFEAIKNNLLKVNAKLLELYLSDVQMNILNKTNAFLLCRDKIFYENDLKIQELMNEIRKSK